MLAGQLLRNLVDLTPPFLGGEKGCNKRKYGQIQEIVFLLEFTY